MKKILSLLLLTPFLGALQTSPWLNMPLELSLSPLYQFSCFPSVQGATGPNKWENQNLLQGNLILPLFYFDVEFEAQFAETTLRDWGSRSAALQVRSQILDDVTGSYPVSLTVGLDGRYVPTRALSDPATPYHYVGNFEGSVAVGKEWSRGTDWLLHLYGFLAAGIANRGAPWLKVLGEVKSNFNNQHRFGGYLNNYFGFGGQTNVNLNDFNGYYNIRHISIDLGVNYAYHFLVWGTISFDYSYRVFARHFPQHAQFFTLKYVLPFSLL